jgi:pimeloyl-ACP methyl ester carboxylesterase
VLIVDGKESRQTRRTDKQQRYDAIEDRRHATIGNAGHMVHQDNPEQLAEVVASFLDLPQA